jgi:hypothetical protein
MYLYLNMKIYKIFLCAIIVCNGFSVYSQKKTVSVQINFMQPYCGGARPTPEIIADAAKAKPYANKTIIIVSAKGKIDSAKTNDAGVLNLKLKVGTYKLFEAWRFYKKATGGLVVSDFDGECLKNEWKKEIKEIVVTKKENKISEKNEIIEICPWNLPCVLESRRPPARE